MLHIEMPSLCIINAPQGRGKSHLIKYILHELEPQLDFGIVFTNTSFNEENYDFIDRKYIHPNYNEDVLKSFMSICSGLIKRGVKKNAFVILDDVLGDRLNASQFLKLCTQLRHYNIYCIVSTQYSNAIPSNIRANAMYVVIFHQDTQRSLHALYDSYGQRFENFNAFKNYIMKRLGDHKFIFIDKKITGSIEDVFKIYKAPAKIPHFTMRYNLTV